MTENSDHLLIFLGDYGDRGPFSAEVHYIVLKLKLLFPKQVILMRGNHEGPVDLQAVPHDLPATFEARFGKGWQEAYDGVRELHQQLYLAVLVENQYLLIHGGLPSTANTIADLADAHKTHPKERILEDMLWSDPDDSIERLYPSPRGAGKLFDQNTTDKALDRFGVKILIRGHEASPEGYQISHKGKILTLFSRKGPPYFNAYGAYLELNLSEKVENAAQLVPYIHKF
jgi:protein phosphatase